MMKLNKMKMEEGIKKESFGILLDKYKELERTLKTKEGKPFDLIESILSGTISDDEIEERCKYENGILDKMDVIRCQVNGIAKEKEA